MKSAVVIVSGGMDSTVLTAHLRNENPDALLFGVSFNYGQRHRKELEYAEQNLYLDTWRVVDLTNINGLLQGSSLTDSGIEVPDGHYAEETMKATVVPNRNMIMLSIAIGFGVSQKVDGGVWFGVHSGDHFIYPDCREEFVRAISWAATVGNEGFGPTTRVTAPFSTWTKADIAKHGTDLGVDFRMTWSCYKGGAIHCGRCGTCVERKEAFALAGVHDVTDYEDAAFEVVANQ